MEEAFIYLVTVPTMILGLACSGAFAVLAVASIERKGEG